MSSDKLKLSCDGVIAATLLYVSVLTVKPLLQARERTLTDTDANWLPFMRCLALESGPELEHGNLLYFQSMWWCVFPAGTGEKVTCLLESRQTTTASADPVRERTNTRAKLRGVWWCKNINISSCVWWKCKQIARSERRSVHAFFFTQRVRGSDATKQTRGDETLPLLRELVRHIVFCTHAQRNKKFFQHVFFCCLAFLLVVRRWCAKFSRHRLMSKKYCFLIASRFAAASIRKV